jgi:hypothetical protein
VHRAGLETPDVWHRDRPRTFRSCEPGSSGKPTRRALDAGRSNGCRRAGSSTTSGLRCSVAGRAGSLWWRRRTGGCDGFQGVEGALRAPAWSEDPVGLPTVALGLPGGILGECARRREGRRPGGGGRGFVAASWACRSGGRQAAGGLTTGPRRVLSDREPSPKEGLRPAVAGCESPPTSAVTRSLRRR